MTYKIINKFTKVWQNYNYIEFELDSYVEFKGRKKQKFIYCLDENPFISYQEGDKIEVDLSITRGMSANTLISGRQGIVSKSYYNSEWDEGEASEEKPKIGGLTTQTSVTLSAYETKAVYDFLYDALEWLELYIEKANLNLQRAKQLPKTITRSDISYMDSKGVKGHFSSTLTGLRVISNDKPQFLLEKLQDEFFSWFDNSEIGVNNCSDELAQSLVDFHSVLIGKREDFAKRRRKETDEEIAKMTTEERSKNFYELIAAYQEPLENQDEVSEAMKGQTYRDVNNESRFSGNADRGKEKFELIKRQQEISQREASRRQELEYLNQGDEMETDELASSSSPAVGSTNQAIRQEIVNYIKRHINEFKIERFFVPIGGGDFDQEDWIVHSSAERKSDGMGGLIFDPKNMYKVKDLTEAEQKEIGYNKSKASIQNFFSVSDTPKNDNKVGTGGIVATVAGISILAIGGVVAIKKKLNKKNKE